MKNMRQPKPWNAPPSNWVYAMTAWYLSAIVLSVALFPVNTHGFQFGSVNVTFAVLAGWGWVCTSFAIELFIRLEQRTHYRNEIFVAVAVALLASGAIAMEGLKARMYLESERSQAYMHGYSLMLSALVAAEKSPGEIARIKAEYGRKIMREMLLKGGITEDFLDAEGILNPLDKR